MRGQRQSDEELEHQLNAWGRNVAMPETPDLAGSVAAILRRQARKPSMLPWQARLSRPALVLAACLGLAIAARLLFYPLTAQPGGGDTILTRAANSRPHASVLVHLTYALSGRGLPVRTLDLWEWRARGSYQGIAVDSGPTVRLQSEFGARSGSVERLSSRPPRLAAGIRHALGAPLVEQDGKLVAQILTGASRSRNLGIRLLGRRRLHGEAAYVLRITGRGILRTPVTLYFSAGSYTLLAELTPNYTMRLVRSVQLPTDRAPEWLKLHSTRRAAPTPATSVGY